MEKQYFIVVDGQHVGPLTKDQLRQKGITSATLVWCQGMPDWQPAMAIGELADIVNSSAAPSSPGYGMPSGGYSQPGAGSYGQPQSATLYYAMINGNRVGPYTPDVIVTQGVNPDTPVWCEGFQDWVAASTVPEIMDAISRRSPYNIPGGNNSYPQSGYPYGQPQGYPGYTGQPFTNTPHTNWLPWAIVGTVLGLGSCLGLIFGVLGIVNANKANNFYAYGNESLGDITNRTAKTWTIISLVLGVLGVIGNISLFSTGLFNGLL